ncbi:hypothetical protein T484DRAFT_1833152 [Baffinella frigidus]|nr:hypothetical protein T484DRAFT_1833152 [Cryptophyta sp. CCMP2293]
MLDALCHLLYPVSAAHTSIFRMDSNSTSYTNGTERVENQRYGAFVSSQHAVGVIVAVGNVGTELSDEASELTTFGFGLALEPLRDEASELTTFVSRDGGISWAEAVKGSTVSDIGDQGSLVLLADNQQATKDISFSIDGGVSFRACEFSGGKSVVVRDVMVDPNATSTNFLVYGHEQDYEVRPVLTPATRHPPPASLVWHSCP